MARRIVTELTDDLDSGTADETVSFALDGRSYEIDLAEKNATKLRKAMAAYISGGRVSVGLVRFVVLGLRQARLRLRYGSGL